MKIIVYAYDSVNSFAAFIL